MRVHIKPYLGQVKLKQLTPHMVQATYNELLEKRKLSPKSIKNIHGVLHRALSQAQKLGYIRVNPLEAVILPRVEKTQIATLQDDKMQLFLEAIKGAPMRLSCLSRPLRVCGRGRCWV